MKKVIIIPTYNEASNITKLLASISKLRLSNIDILIVDDNSPDGTSKIVKKFTEGNKLNNRVFVLDRKKKEGLGKAYIAGFKWALNREYGEVVTMDADFSHSPETLPKMIKLSQQNPRDIILGSRYVKGGEIQGWGLKRYLNSYLANFFTRLILGLKAKDTTAGFKCYPREFLEEINFKNLVASGYAFQVEMLYLADREGYKVIEFPITFVDRHAGQSKIAGELGKSARIVIRLAIQRKSLRQFVKFSIVGIINVFIDWGIFFLIKFMTGWQTQDLKQIMKGLSFTVSATSSYFMNRIWTFRSREKAILKQAIKFFSVAVVGLGLNNFIFYIITGILHWRDLFGLAIATLIVLFWNFVANNFWVFAEKK